MDDLRSDLNLKEGHYCRSEVMPATSAKEGGQRSTTDTPSDCCGGVVSGKRPAVEELVSVAVPPKAKRCCCH